MTAKLKQITRLDKRIKALLMKFYPHLSVSASRILSLQADYEENPSYTLYCQRFTGSTGL